MKYGLLSVSNSEPCPFCSHTDWCFKMQIEDYNGYIRFCNRIPGMEKEQQVLGNDGNTYLVVGNSRSGATVFEEKNQHYARFPKKYGVQPILSAKAAEPKPFVFENIAEPLDPVKLDCIYRDMLSLLKLETKHEEYLLKEGFSPELIKKHRICSLPENDSYRFSTKSYSSINPWRKQIGDALFRKYGDLTGVPGLFKNKKGQWTIAGPGGILFPQYDLNGKLYRLRLRVDRQYFDLAGNEITKEKAEELKKQGIKYRFTGKYLNFASFRKDTEKAKENIICNIFDGGCASGNNLGFYISKGNDLSKIVFTEGEKKSIVGCERYNHPFIDIPGVNSFTKVLERDSFGLCLLDYLKSYGVKVLLIGFDADKAVNAAVLSCESGLVQILQEWGFEVGILGWDVSLGKGLDDLLVAGYEPEITYL